MIKNYVKAERFKMGHFRILERLTNKEIQKDDVRAAMQCPEMTSDTLSYFALGNDDIRICLYRAILSWNWMIVKKLTNSIEQLRILTCQFAAEISFFCSFDDSHQNLILTLAFQIISNNSDW